MEMYAPAFWTPDFLAEFKARRKYDLTKYLPVLFNGDNTWGQILPPYGNRTFTGAGTDGGQGVNDDYRTTLTELNQRYIQHMQDWSHQKGLEFSNQPAYNLPLDMVRPSTTWISALKTVQSLTVVPGRPDPTP